MIIQPDSIAAQLSMYQGNWHVSFHEVYHADGAFWPLCDVCFDPVSLADGFQVATNGFRVEPRLSDTPAEVAAATSDSSGFSGHASLASAMRVDFATCKDARINEALRDADATLAGCLVRAGLLRPVFDSDTISELAESHGAILVPDTNAILYGSLHYICRHFNEHIGYVAVPEDVEQEIRKKTTVFKELVDKILLENRTMTTRPAASKDLDLFGLRPFAQNALIALAAGTLPVEYEILPIRASSLKSAGGDEEIIRTVVEGLKRRSITAKAFLLTQDYNMARFCHIRGLHVIFCRRPDVNGTSPPYSIRYDYRSNKLSIIDVADFLWELAYAFNTIRIEAEDGSVAATLESHARGISYSDWLARRMTLTISKKPITAPILQPEAKPAIDHPANPEAERRVYEVSFRTFLDGVVRTANAEIELSTEAWTASLGLTPNNLKSCLFLGERLGFWRITGKEVIEGTGQLLEFYEQWQHDGPAFVAQQLTTQYRAFARFCELLETRSQISIRGGKIQEGVDLSQTEIKYLRPLGELLLKCRFIDGILIWTGSEVPQPQFENSLRRAYLELRGQRDLVGIAELVNWFYVEHHISHEAFRAHLEAFVSSGGEKVETSGSIALPSERRNSFDVLDRPTQPGFVRRVNLEDGFVIGARTVKALSLDSREGS